MSVIRPLITFFTSLLLYIPLSFASGISDFTSDGCSLFPDGTFKDRSLWCDCCLQHDIAYWQGGSREERSNADESLRSCVEERTGSSVLAKVMFDGVRAGGHPVFPNWYRWGYGWTYGRGYAPLTPEERQQAEEKLRLYLRERPRGFCGKTTR